MAWQLDLTTPPLSAPRSDLLVYQILDSVLAFTVCMYGAFHKWNYYHEGQSSTYWTVVAILSASCASLLNDRWTLLDKRRWLCHLSAIATAS